MSFLQNSDNKDLSPFALVKFPGKSAVFLIKEESQGENFYSFTSFDNIKKYKFSFGKIHQISLSEIEKEINIPLSYNENTRVASKDEYLSLLDKTIQFLKEKKARKIVISREKWIGKDKINPVQSFLFLCRKYPDSFCHLSFWNEKEVWIGATPEILGTFENDVFRTMALAGSLPDEESCMWKDKEIREQRFVTEYIHDKLKNFSLYISRNGPNTLHLGHIKHLVTYFSANLADASVLTRLIENLHPTPAVCGFPLKVSRDFILREEGYNRDFYSGYIGIKTSEFEKYFVNLRSGRLYKNGALLFMGGGITAESNPETEWEETELKSKFVAESL